MSEGSHLGTQDDSGSAKRTYDKPELIVYGDIREITQSVGAMGPSDGAPSGPKNSQL